MSAIGAGAAASVRQRLRGRMPALWLSVGLNAFLLAAFAARLTAPPPPPPLGQPPIARIVATLGADDAARFRAAMDAHRARIDASRAAVSAAQAQLAAAIRASPYDPPAVRAALASWQSEWQRFVVAFDAGVLAGLAELSDTGRGRFAEASLAEDARHVAAQRAYLDQQH